MLMIFSILFNNQKVVEYEVNFIVEKFQNFFPSKVNSPKRRSNSAAIFTRLGCLDVRTLGLGLGLLYSMFLF